MATGENTWFAVPYPEPHVSLNFIPIGIESMNAILFTCIYLMFVWNLGVYVYTIHGSYGIGFCRIFTKHVVHALSGPSLFCKPSTTQHMWPVVICPQHVAAQASLFWQFRWGHLAFLEKPAGYTEEVWFWGVKCEAWFMGERVPGGPLPVINGAITLRHGLINGQRGW